MICSLWAYKYAEILILFVNRSRIAIIILLLLPAVFAAPSVLLIDPANGYSSASTSVTFICNASDTNGLFNVSLYHNIGGTFAAASTKTMLTENDTNTLMLCRFDNNYTCEGGEVGVNTSTSFAPGIRKTGVQIDGSLNYTMDNNINYAAGTIEFWVKLGFDPTDVSTYTLFDTDGSGQNELMLSVSDSSLYFDFWDNVSNTLETTGDVSSWSQDEWHFVAVTWDVAGDQIVYLDGLNDTSSSSGDFTDSDIFRGNLYIGNSMDGTGPSTSLFDEFRISSVARSGEEIYADYMNEVSNHTSELVNFTVNSVPDGTYAWNCLAANNETANFSSTNYTFTINTAPPAQPAPVQSGGGGGPAPVTMNRFYIEASERAEAFENSTAAIHARFITDRNLTRFNISFSGYPGSVYYFPNLTSIYNQSGIWIYMSGAPPGVYDMTIFVEGYTKSGTKLKNQTSSIIMVKEDSSPKLTPENQTTVNEPEPSTTSDNAWDNAFKDGYNKAESKVSDAVSDQWSPQEGVYTQLVREYPGYAFSFAVVLLLIAYFIRRYHSTKKINVRREKDH